MKRFRKDDGGATAIEAGLIVALVAIAAVSFYRMGVVDGRAQSIRLAIAEALGASHVAPRALKCINCGD